MKTRHVSTLAYFTWITALVWVLLGNTMTAQELSEKQTEVSATNSGKTVETTFSRDGIPILTERKSFENEILISTKYLIYNSKKELCIIKEIHESGFSRTDIHYNGSNRSFEQDFQSDGHCDFIAVEADGKEDEFFVVSSKRHIRPLPPKLYTAAKEGGSFKLALSLIEDYWNSIQ